MTIVDELWREYVYMIIFCCLVPFLFNFHASVWYFSKKLATFGTPMETEDIESSGWNKVFRIEIVVLEIYFFLFEIVQFKE